MKIISKKILLAIVILYAYNNSHASSLRQSSRKITPIAQKALAESSSSTSTTFLPASHMQYSTMVNKPYKNYSYDFNNQAINQDQDRSFMTWKDLDNLKREAKNLVEKFSDEEYRAEAFENKAKIAFLHAEKFKKQAFETLEEMEQLTSDDVNDAFDRFRQKSIRAMEEAQTLTPEDIKYKANKAHKKLKYIAEDAIDDTQEYLKKLNKKYEQEDKDEFEEFKKWRKAQKNNKYDEEGRDKNGNLREID